MEVPRRDLTCDMTKTHSRLHGSARVIMVSRISWSKYRSWVIAYLMSEKKFWNDIINTSTPISSVTPNGNIPTVSKEGNVSSVFEVIIAMWGWSVCLFSA